MLDGIIHLGDAEWHPLCLRGKLAPGSFPAPWDLCWQWKHGQSTVWATQLSYRFTWFLSYIVSLFLDFPLFLFPRVWCSLYVQLSLFISKGLSTHWQNWPLTTVGWPIGPHHRGVSAAVNKGLALVLAWMPSSLLPAVLMPFPRLALLHLLSLSSVPIWLCFFYLTGILSGWLQCRISLANDYTLKIGLQAGICDCKIFPQV